MHSTTRPAGEHIFRGVLSQPHVLDLCAKGNFVTPCRVGLECCKEIRWLECKPGHEYTRNCTIKNISPDVAHLSWTLPTSRLFVLEYPEPIDLSPGMSYSIKVCSFTSNIPLLAVCIAVSYSRLHVIAAGGLLSTETRASGGSDQLLVPARALCGAVESLPSSCETGGNQMHATRLLSNIRLISSARC